MQTENRKRIRLEERPSTSTSNSLAMTAQDLINACIELVTKNGRPLNIFTDSGFKKLIQLILRTINPPIAINENSIREAIIHKAIEIRNEIKEEIGNKLVCLKIDGATRHGRSFIGVNIQYILNRKIIIRTLGLREMFERSTSENLKNLILNILREYDITVHNIYTITTDNGSVQHVEINTTSGRRAK